MKLYLAIPALIAATLPAALAAEPWKEVARLTGDIAVELDAGSVTPALDGANAVVLATFRKELPNAMMETEVAIDCTNATAKIRGIHLTDGPKVFTGTSDPYAPTKPINYGSVESIYFKALCDKDIPQPPESTADAPPAAPATEPAQGGAAGGGTE